MTNLSRILGAAVFSLVGALPLMEANHAHAAQGVIREINLVHFSHTDVGFTDHPTVCRELYRRYLDVALDAVMESSNAAPGDQFCWTAEATMPVLDWWQAASTDRRAQFIEAVRSGRLEVTALPFNNTPFMDAAQWRTMLRWLPEDLWREVQPKAAVQNDVNGIPRAAAMAMLDRGVRYLFTGINEDSGGVPFARPSAFWWKMPDGRRMFVWLNIGYGSGFDFFEPGEWRRGPVPRAADTTYRPPRAGDILKADEASVRAAHALCLERLRGIEQGGYRYPILTISITSQWRFDNDPPFPPLGAFVATWNKLGLMPRLRLANAHEAMRRMEQVMADTIPEHSGEWTDWWANGTASAPREVAASRVAKRLLAAAASPAWGPLTDLARATMDQVYRELCLFDEHTWGSSLSVAKPYSLDTQGQFNEKAGLAFRSMARAEWLLAQRARTRLVPEGEGVFLGNPAGAPYTGWVRMIATSLREPYQSVQDPKIGIRRKLYFEPGIAPWGRPQGPGDLSREDISATFPDHAPGKAVKFWVDQMDANSIRRLRFSTEPVIEEVPSASAGPRMEADGRGWAGSMVWPGMKKPLFLSGFGDLSAVQVKAFAPRWALADIRGQEGAARERMRKELLVETLAEPAGKAEQTENAHTIVLSQPLKHPRLAWGTRVLEVWKREPRARLTLRVNRLSSADPEIFYVACPLPTGSALPRLSSGGVPFTPFTDQIAGTCRDYFAIDGWAEYTTGDGRWLWVSRDAPLIALGSSPTLAKLRTAPKDPNRLLAMLFNNFWYTNFADDEHGILEYQFDLVWDPEPKRDAAALADSLNAEPVLVINPALAEDARVLRHLYSP